MKILHLISSPRGEASISIKLGNAIVKQLQSDYPGSSVTVNDLTKDPLPVLEAVHIQSFFTPAESRSPELVDAVKHSDNAIAQLKETDILVIGVPFYNFSIHSGLKNWIDHIVRVGQTFSYSEDGPKGLVEHKKVYLAVASGGIYSKGPMQSMDFAVPYMRAVLGCLGMTDMTVVRAEGLNIPGIKEHALDNAIAEMVL